MWKEKKEENDIKNSKNKIISNFDAEVDGEMMIVKFCYFGKKIRLNFLM